MSTIKTTRKYKAFISYKHSEIGRKHAIALEVALKGYAKPLLSRPPKIFRDEKHMVPSNDLSKLITSGLEESEYLIFIAENGAATSKWCCDELEYWCGTLGRKENLIILHAADAIHLDIANNKVDWEQTTALPSLLEKYISSIPLYVDVHQLQEPHELALEHPQYNSIINLISAKLRGIAPEELNDEALRVHRKNLRLRNWAIGILSVMLLVSMGASVFAFQKQGEAEKSAKLAETSAQEARDSSKVAKEQREIAVLQQEIAENNQVLAEENAQVAKDNLIKANRRFASYLMSEAHKAFENEDIRLAFRLAEFANKYDEKNIKAITLKKKLPSYASQFYLEGNDYELNRDSLYFAFTNIHNDTTTNLNILTLDDKSYPRIFKDILEYKFQYSNYYYSPNGKYLIFYVGEKNEEYSTLKLVTLDGSFPTRTFQNSDNHKYTPDGKYLTFFTKNQEDWYSTLNILTLDSDSPPKIFKKIGNYNYSPHWKHLISLRVDMDGRYSLSVMTLNENPSPRTFENGINYSFSPDGKYLTFYVKDSVEEYSTFNIIPLESRSPPRTFKNIKKYQYSPDGKYLTFYTKNQGEEYSTLNILSLDSDLPLRVFENSYYNEDSKPYSPDGKYLAFYTRGKKGNYSILNILNLHSKSPPRTFENIDNHASKYSDDYSFSYSPNSKYLIFHETKENSDWSSLNILSLGDTTPVRTFENCFRIKNVESFSPDGKYLAFYKINEEAYSPTLNVLNLESNLPPRSFTNSNIDSYFYNSNGKYLAFYTIGNKKGKEYSILNILDLNSNFLPRTFKYSNPDKDSNSFSRNGKYLAFYTKGKNGEHSTLNILNLAKNLPPRIFENIQSINSNGYTNDSYTFSGDENFLIFLTPNSKGKNEEYTTVNVLTLDSNSPPRTFENIYIYYEKYRYSPDWKYLAINVERYDGVFNVHLLELKSGKILRTIHHQYVPTFTFLNENTFLSESTNPTSERKIYKIVNLSLGDNQKSFEYYKEHFYKALTIPEKERYGIID